MILRPASTANIGVPRLPPMSIPLCDRLPRSAPQPAPNQKFFVGQTFPLRCFFASCARTSMGARLSTGTWAAPDEMGKLPSSMSANTTATK